MVHHLLDRHREPDDPAQQREVPEAERVSRHCADAIRGCGREPAFGRALQPPEVAPPQQARDRKDRDDDPHQRRGARLATHGRPRGDERLPQRDDHEEAMALAEVRRTDVPCAPTRAHHSRRR